VYTSEGAEPREGHCVAILLLGCAEPTMAVLSGSRIALSPRCEVRVVFFNPLSAFWQVEIAIVCRRVCIVRGASEYGRYTYLCLKIRPASDHAHSRILLRTIAE
jgi:hypothetical protein